MHKDRSRGKSLFQGITCHPTFVIKIPQSVLPSKMSEQNDYIQIIENKTSVEVGES